ncbi:MAG TPA: RNA polymerase subunit sigma-70 [Candidatus Dormibacteraeota bacterium]
MLPDSADAFGEQVARHQNELLVHCYRMLGTIDEAEDAVQDTLARAWQGRQTFRRAISFRSWLYRIATNVCLNAIELRKRDPVDERHVIGPSPDNVLSGIAPTETGPEARFDAHESVSLAFLTVLQLLPPRQRAVLLLRDVLVFRAAEVAALLDMSVPAVNSAHQRARATLRRNYNLSDRSRATMPARQPSTRNLLERYVRAWEAADVAGLMALLHDDAVLTMPPQPTVVGARPIADFLAESIFTIAPMRLFETHANGSPAFAAYFQEPTGIRLSLFALLVVADDGHQVVQIHAFADPRVLARFDLATELAG